MDSVISQAEWQRGLTLEELIPRMDVNQEAMRRRRTMVRLTGAERERLSRLHSARNILVLTEEWCSDCLMNLPILTAIAAAAPMIDLKLFIRKDWPDLRTYFNSRDIYSLPTVQIMDENFLPLAVWIERPQAAHQRLAQWKLEHPEVERTRRRADLTSEQKREMLNEFSSRLLVEMEGWYDEELQSETVREVTELLEKLEPAPVNR
jgi:hypothetical protein